MDLTAEQISELGLNEELAPKVSSFLSDQIATVKQEFDGLANRNAENILTGASKKILDDTGVERNQGEKMGDYITRAWGEFNSSKLKGVDEKIEQYEAKLKDFKGNEDLIGKINSLESEKDTLLKKFANFDEIKEKAEQFDPLREKYEANKIQVAFSGVKPSFPDTVNRYEAAAKWNEFKSGILDKYTIEFDNGEAVAVSKENQYSQKKLSDLVGGDEALQTLQQGRQQGGTGGKQIPKMKIDGVPFDVPENVDNITKSKLIKEYLTKTKGINPMSTEYAKGFAELNTRINNNKKV